MSEASRATSSPKRQYIPEPSREAIAEVSSEVGVSMVESADDYDETLQSLELPCYRMDSEPRGQKCYCIKLEFSVHVRYYYLNKVDQR